MTTTRPSFARPARPARSHRPEPLERRVMLSAAAADADVAAEASVTPAHLGSYHTYDTLTSDLQAFAAARPAITRLTSLGQSVQGREI